MSSSGHKDEGTLSDSFPGSPSATSSHVALPRWSLPSWRHNRPLLGGRLKTGFLAICCIALGCVLTSSLGPDPRSQDLLNSSAISVGDYKGPAAHSPLILSRPGIIGDDVEDIDRDDGLVHEHEPSVSGALADLHDAVKGKLQSWNPYFVKPSQDLGNGMSKGAVNTAVTPPPGEDIRDGIGENERLGAKVRIGKCTILFNGNSFWERAIRTHEEHDREHGYRLHVLRQQLLDDVWSKPAYILSLLLRELAKPESERLDWLFWVDADTIILNPHIPIDLFLPPPGTEFDDVHLIYSNDWNGLNNGVFPIRVHQWSVQLFSAITAYRQFRPNDPLQFRDQSAMDSMMHEAAFVDHIMQAPQRWFNAYQGEHNETLAPFQTRRGDLLVHFAGIPAREERMGYWLERVEQHLDEWEVPVKSTSYPQEVRDFWAEQWSLRQQRKEMLASTRLRLKDLCERVSQRLSEYGDRLSEEQKATIEAQRDDATRTLEDGQLSSNNGKMEEAARKLEEVMQPLMLAITEAQKMLLNQAHAAIFGAEKALLEGDFGDGVTAPELERVSDTIKALKNLVMAPQEHWNRQDIISATNAVTAARVSLHHTPASAVPSVATSWMVPSETLGLEEVQEQLQAKADAVAELQ